MDSDEPQKAQSPAETELERTILDRQLHGVDSKASHSQFWGLLEYTTLLDKFVLFISCVCAIVSGALNPLLTVVYGQLVGVFDGFAGGEIPASYLRSQISVYSLYYVYLGIAIFVLTYISTVGFYFSGERLTRNLRQAYLKAMLRQNIAFFDLLGSGEVSTRIMTDMGLIQEGITSKLAFSLTAVSTFAAALIIAFVMYWKTALILSPTFVVMVASASVGGAYAVRYHKESKIMQNRAFSLAEEAIASVRHICAYGVQQLIADRYFSYLTEAGKPDIKARTTVTTMISWKNAMPCLAYALSFWAGSIYLVQGQVSVSHVATTTLVITIGGWAIARVTPSIQAFTASIASASAILKSISRRSPQDPFSDGGEVLGAVAGDIELSRISLKYPSRRNISVLNEVSFFCPAKKTTAIVGASGCGKSSIIGLLERFYEPTGGSIRLDGADIQSLNLKWLRSQIALVGQEPVLFDTTIFENIKFGSVHERSSLSSEELEQRIFQAASAANAHGFITSLPKGYQTEVGEKGTQLSGGQRQRIAIARALMRDPKVLLLDEATSALDTQSESIIQQALDQASKQRTTIVIAHRLSTIRHADNIVVMSNGKVMEQGSHEELVERKGIYAGLVQKQHIEKTTTPDSETSTLSTTMNEKTEHRLEDKSVAPADAIAITKHEQQDSSSSASDATSPNLNHSAGLTLGQTLKFITSMNRPEMRFLLIGLLCATISGFGVPAQAIVFAKILDVLALPPAQYDQLRSGVNLYCWLYFMLAWVAFIFWMGVGIAFAYSTERLGRRVRNLSFRSILSQDMRFFDIKEHSTGALSGLLSSSTEDLMGLSGAVIGGVLTFISTILTGIVLAIAIGWKLALVCTACIPLVVACGWIRLQMLAVMDTRVRQAGRESASYASELVRSVKTVASLGMEDFVLAEYRGLLAQFAFNSLKSISVASILYAASQSLTFFCAALIFWYGGNLIADNEYSLFQFYICFVALISGSQIAATIFSYAPDASKAMHAGQELKEVLNEKPIINNSGTGTAPSYEKGNSGCSIRFQDASLRYPARPERLSLDGLNLTVKAGQTIALVGPSGCGKSSIISLLERFYDPERGTIEVNGVSIAEYDVYKYRQMISLVSQDTFLFSGTIRENIAIGNSNEDVSNETIMDVCKQANIHEFVNSLPEGLATLVGTSGSMLSGGQKQRICIARALLRQPRILLLDEATAALDAESEMLVQQALDSASQSRTTIVAAHRLNTIKNADLICVLDQGKVIERGAHQELMSVKGRYWDLVNMQDLN